MKRLLCVLVVLCFANVSFAGFPGCWLPRVTVKKTKVVAKQTEVTKQQTVRVQRLQRVRVFNRSCQNGVCR